MEVLTAGDSRIEVNPEAGCRIGSLVADGLELLAHVKDDPIFRGCYPMVPWAGRLALGQLRFGGQVHQLPLNLPPHAIHGTLLAESWTRLGAGEYRAELGEPWPFGGHVRQSIRLDPARLCLRLEVHADDRPMPAACGWHPWFRRRLDWGEAVELEFAPSWMAAKDGAGIPTGELVAPTPGPWDDCFGGLAGAPVLSWPGALRLTAESSCPYWVVFDALADALCVEPQTALPNALNRAPTIVEPGHPLTAEFCLSWERLGG